MDNTVLWCLISLLKAYLAFPTSPQFDFNFPYLVKNLFSYMTEHFKYFVKFEFSNKRLNVGLTCHPDLQAFHSGCLKDLYDCLHPCSSVVTPHCLIKYPKHQHMSTFDWLIHNLPSVLIFSQNFFKTFE